MSKKLIFGDAKRGVQQDWDSLTFTEEFRPLLNKARARLCLDARFLDAMTWPPYLHLTQTTKAFEPAEIIQMFQLWFVGPTRAMPPIDLYLGSVGWTKSRANNLSSMSFKNVLVHCRVDQQRT